MINQTETHTIDSEPPLPVSVPFFSVLGVRVNAVQIPEVIRLFEGWIAERSQSRFVAVCNVHMVMEAQSNPQFLAMLNSSGLTVPDGKPLTWLGRHRGFDLNRRVYGPDLFQDFLAATRTRGYRHFFYGGRAEVTERMVEIVRERYPGTEIAGYYAPPFRPLTPQEDAHVIDLIRESRADILWVGLGCPKQEIWMYEHRERLNVPVMIGVGQAFNIVAGSLKQAPAWMRENGLEWLFRLLLEPRRLWRRYLLYNARFLFCIARELLGYKFSSGAAPRSN
jgi:N-acetylglucosaminyldiphosphoundecaprenol N-acetyl-beta-D-mannosaminyltransferase